MKEKKRKKERDQAKVWMLDFGMDSSSELYDFCIQITWVSVLGFSLKIKLVPFFLGFC